MSSDIFGLQVLTVHNHIKRGKFVSGHLHLDCCFLIEADDSTPIYIKPDENSKVGWVDIKEASTITREDEMKPIYEKVNDKLAKLDYKLKSVS